MRLGTKTTAGMILFLAAAKALGAGASTNETRLETRLFNVGQTKHDEKYDVEEESAAGATVESSESKKSDDYDVSSAFPLLSVTAFNDGLVLGASLLSDLPSFTVATIVGKQMSRTFELGLYTELSYSTEKETSKVEPDAGTSTEEKTHDATRDLAVGPYMRLTVPSGGSKLEILSILRYLRHQSDSNSSFGSPQKEQKTGFGLATEVALVIPLNKNLHYFGALNLSYDTYTSGKKVDEGSTSTKTSKLKSDKEQGIGVCPLGLRLVL